MNYDRIDLNKSVPMVDICSDQMFNCRGLLDIARLIELADSIKVYGLQMPIVICPYAVAPYKFRIISGYRRYAACVYLKWKTIPAIVHKLPLQLEELRFLNLIENINRQDLTSDEIAEVIRQLGSEGFTYKEIGIKLHKTTAWVRTYSLLNELSPRAAKLAIKNLLSQSAIEYVSAYPKDKQEALIRDKFTRPDRHLAKPVRSRKELREMAAYLHKINQPAEIRAISWMLNHLTTDQFLGSINESSSNVPNSI